MERLIDTNVICGEINVIAPNRILGAEGQNSALINQLILLWFNILTLVGIWQLSVIGQVRKHRFMLDWQFGLKTCTAKNGLSPVENQMIYLC
uniref:Sparc-1 n=1 Tax=Schmidtea mediterranea TaxID=79327 RepID=I1ZIC9_SCHMD|nr:sparc-1 [Schmidtea mediterranea]